jgi:glycosyltransferase involved in cell wall biosynthesis
MNKISIDAQGNPKSQSINLSVVIPVHNGGGDLKTCFEALLSSTRQPDEIIIVDDASTDDSVELASHYGTVISSQSQLPVGPAKCRNHGVSLAKGDIVVFLDADVEVHQDTLALVERHFEENPEIAALFGSYDDQPPHRSLVTLYKNLQHHFVHQQSQRDASTFWTGLGAIRRDVFMQIGGFSEGYSHPSIEDIELGVRLTAAGYQIHLCKEIQATHLKRWTLVSLLRTDVRDRAIPWARLIFSTGRLPADLNLDWKSRASSVCAWGILPCVLAGFWMPAAWIGILALGGFIVFANFRLYRFFQQRGGLWFATGAVLLHFLYFLYSSLTFGLIWLEHLISRKSKKISVSYESTGD